MAAFELRFHTISGAFQCLEFNDEATARKKYAISERDETVVRSTLQVITPSGSITRLASFDRSY